ncbi:hypothetical protein T484DRAFT_1879279, partial [Baffinella frigidus]
MKDGLTMNEGGREKFCRKHRPRNFIDVAAPVCEKGECGTHASYGWKGKHRARCALHRSSGMVNLRHRMCECGRIASFGPEGGTPVSCKTHASAGHTNVRYVAAGGGRGEW